MTTLSRPFRFTQSAELLRTVVLYEVGVLFLENIWHITHPASLLWWGATAAGVCGETPNTPSD